MTTNSSGYFPLLHRILVLPQEVEIKKGMVFVPDEFTARDEMAQLEATVVAVGPEVFADQAHSTPPKPGDVVLFAKLAGFFVPGDDGKRYRVINDLDLVAIKGRVAE